jgi:hypothetical protein
LEGGKADKRNEGQVDKRIKEDVTDSGRKAEKGGRNGR